MEENAFDIGMIGLGVMGRNFVLNMADRGFAVLGYDRNPEKAKSLGMEQVSGRLEGVSSMQAFAAGLRPPRAAMMLVPAGEAVDQVIDALEPHLEPGDIILDGGNSNFADTDRRQKAQQERGIHFLGVGISGGAQGARQGPSIMPGGDPKAYARVQSIFEASAAQVGGEPCAAYLGAGAAGHYVKMVHNGIEYGLMQLIAEVYDLMKRGMQLEDSVLAQAFLTWSQEELQGYLIEITADILQTKDKASGDLLLNRIQDAAKQKGTGRWTSQSAMDLGIPIPTIDVAVAMRSLSARKDERAYASKVLGQGDTIAGLQVEQVRAALYAAMIITYAQGMDLLQAASLEHDYRLDLEVVARIWRGGCIIRAALLEPMRAAYRQQPNLRNLLLNAYLSQQVLARQSALRQVVAAAAQAGLPVPGLMASLGYLDAYRSARLPANLIQAQRDYFGAHTYERVDQEGTFHTDWQAAEDMGA